MFFLAFAQFKGAIRSPGSLVEKDGGERSFCEGGDCLGEDENIDTDKDGIKDSDEINIYETSPYLPDTDGDGIDDKEELLAGTDPNCPKGKDCSQAGETNFISGGVASGGTTTSKDLNLDEIINTQSAEDADLNEDAMELIMEGGANAEQLREALINIGMKKNVLDRISDEELMRSYRSQLD